MTCMQSKTILVVRACALGDFVLNLPALEALQEARPHGRFTLVGYPETLRVASPFLNIDSTCSIETLPWSRLFHEPVANIPRFDEAVVWMKDGAYAHNLQLSGVPIVRHLPPFPSPELPPIHARTHLLRTLALAERPSVDRWRGGLETLLVHPGSGSPSKNWPHFVQLAHRLSKVLFLLGPAEASDAPVFPALRNRPLAEVTELLTTCAAYVGNDSGVTHLAAYLGCPTVAIFGPTNPTIWSPVGPRVRVIHHRDLSAISVDDVLKALNSLGVSTPQG